MEMNLRISSPFYTSLFGLLHCFRCFVWLPLPRGIIGLVDAGPTLQSECHWIQIPNILPKLFNRFASLQ